MTDTKKQEIESIIKKAKSIKVRMCKEKLHGLKDDKFVVYVVYKIGKYRPYGRFLILLYWLDNILFCRKMNG